MKHVRIAQHFNDFLKLLSNLKTVDKVKTPLVKPKVIMVKKKSECGLDWKLNILGSEFSLKIIKGDILITHTAQNGYTWTRTMEGYISILKNAFPFNHTTINELQDKYLQIKNIVKSMIKDSKTHNKLTLKDA